MILLEVIVIVHNVLRFCLNAIQKNVRLELSFIVPPYIYFYTAEYPEKYFQASLHSSLSVPKVSVCEE